MQEGAASGVDLLNLAFAFECLRRRECSADCVNLLHLACVSECFRRSRRFCWSRGCCALC